LIIAHGRILADDTPAGLEAQSRFHNAVTIKLRDAGQTATVNSALMALGEVASTEVDRQAGRLTAFPAPNKLPLKAISQLAAQQNWDLAELHLESGRLDEVFRTVTGGASA
jgi:ABC-2 type transport system ATP-binding protein